MDVGFLTYHAWAEPEKSVLERFFSGVKSRVSVHRHHIEHTTTLYKNELNLAKQKIETGFKQTYLEAQERYEASLGTYEDEQEDHQWAYHNSGMGQIENDNEQQHFSIEEQYSELLDLFHSSAIIQACSLLEKELKDICDILKIESGEIISQYDFASKDYIGGCIKYLQLVIKINVKQLDPFLNKIKDIQYLRNRLIHDRGEFLKSEDKLDDKLKIMKSIINASSKRINLIEKDNVHIIRISDAEYILDFLDVFLNFFQQILILIEEKFDYRIFKAKMGRILGSLQAPHMIENTNSTKKERKAEVNSVIRFVNSTDLPDLQVELKMKKAKTDKVYCAYHGSVNQAISTLANNLKTMSHVLLNQFYDYFIIHEKIEIDLKYHEIET